MTEYSFHDLPIKTTTPASDDYFAIDGATNGTRGLLVSSKENVSNKETSALDASTTKYPCNNVVKTALDLKANASTTPIISSGTGAPTSTPTKIGDIYVDTVLKHIYVAKGTSSSADWVKVNGSYTLQYGNANGNPADSNTYYIGLPVNLAPTVGANLRKIYIPSSGVITSVYGSFFVNVNASSETFPIYVRVNDTTDYLITNSLKLDATVSEYINTALNIPVVAGDYVEIKYITPAFTTNPTGVVSNGTIRVDL